MWRIFVFGCVFVFFQAKLVCTNNYWNGSSHISYYRAFSRDSNEIKCREKPIFDFSFNFKLRGLACRLTKAYLCLI